MLLLLYPKLVVEEKGVDEPVINRSNRHIVNMRCRDEGVIRTRIKPPVKTRTGYRIAERASRAFLSARIRETYLR